MNNALIAENIPKRSHIGVIFIALNMLIKNKHFANLIRYYFVSCFYLHTDYLSLFLLLILLQISPFLPFAHHHPAPTPYFDDKTVLVVKLKPKTKNQNP